MYCLKVYRSLLPIESTEGNVGLHYIKENEANASFANGMTFCLRFNYKRLSEQGTAIWRVGKPPGHMYIPASYPIHQKWWMFDGNTGPIPFFYANQWQHLCIAYDEINNSLTITKVNKNNTYLIF